MKQSKGGTPRTNRRKVVCSECGANINSYYKIIHSRRRHPFLRKYLAENICTDAFLPELHSSGDLDMMPELLKVIQIFRSIPATSCSSEGSFFNLKGPNHP